jgi:hypothetical protein
MIGFPNPGPSGYTATHLAAQMLEEKALRLLLTKGADPTLQTSGVMNTSLFGKRPQAQGPLTPGSVSSHNITPRADDA